MTSPAPSASPAAASLWLRRYRPDETAAVRLFCFPHGGGSASAHVALARELAPWVEALAVQYPGRQDRRGEPFLTTVDATVDALLPVLREAADRPYAFFGHSLGATLAYESARRLSAAGHPPAHLFVSGRRSPSLPRRDLAYLRDDEALIAEVAKMQGCDPRLLKDSELLEMVLPALRNDARMADGYRPRPEPALTVPLTVLTGDADPQVTLDEARAWRDVTEDGALALHVLPGGHFYLDDDVPAVCRLVEQALGHTGRPGATPAAT
ncbi:surfactin synthase thioesterase subunit [Streptomyces sp. CZ24]|uniref:thioesterase II family protein n=1 Tax=Streptomyces TaxID=1883 RepID=UPI001A3AB3C9|nr:MULTISPECIES: alpha/beta fold hydrolase [unclassified Streptomyces]MBL0780304.1 thioesterase [Streptomyces albidoflavus]MBL0802990.1 thioesterase [Streptomyces albidoflavus]MBV1957489.1 thioesterase [Streptomyces sp. BV333]MCK2145477.1 alpha/beta fold hydrolase [Streptomyces sp. WAC00276]MDH6193303.1 surfactin synthase thioesterase subunit [Streptomyces sp. CZ24]